MFWVIVGIVVVLFFLWKFGLFRKPAQCQGCGKQLKGTQQIVYGTGDTSFILCSECHSEIPLQIRPYAMSEWKHEDYMTFTGWNSGTKEERQLFSPTDVYGRGELSIDTDHGLFQIGKNGAVLRFVDLKRYEFGFKASDAKDGLLGAKIIGDEFITVDMFYPYVYLENILKHNVSYKLKQKGFISTKYEYEFSQEYTDIINTFEIMAYLAKNAQQTHSETQTMQATEIDEVQKALALFMFDSLDDVTEDNLKKQRNALIKAFHPDNNESNEAYSQKINSAYDILHGFLKQ